MCALVCLVCQLNDIVHVHVVPCSPPSPPPPPPPHTHTGDLLPSAGADEEDELDDMESVADKSGETILTLCISLYY